MKKLLLFLLPISLINCGDNDKLLDAKGFIIKKITVSNYPETPTNRSSWDSLSSNPDVFLEMIEFNGCPNLLCPTLFLTNYINESQGTLTFDISSPTSLLSADKTYHLNIYDYDGVSAYPTGNQRDLMYTHVFKEELYVNHLKGLNYPNVFDIDLLNTEEIEIIFEVEYEF